MIDIRKLEHEISEIGITKETMAQKCGFTRQTLNNKLKNPDTITASDAYAIKNALRIDNEKFMSIFFASDAEKNCNTEAV